MSDRVPPKGKGHGSTSDASSEAPSHWTKLSEIPRKLPFAWLADITDYFADERKLGNGSFGVVYKGILPSGQIVAVKRLMNILGPQDVQFENEVNHLMMLEHKHIVGLVGYCHEIQVREHRGRYIPAVAAEKILCYEYMANGSLDSMIYDASLRPDWNMYCRIITGICLGLYYLHEARIIHLDLKPSNVLLDGSMQPKLADFGLSRLFGEDQTMKQTTTVVGTIGYMAPEYIGAGEITTKSDIYSLGVLILEIVTGEKNLSRDVSGLQYINNDNNYTLPARSLEITWSNNSSYWRWIRIPNNSAPCKAYLVYKLSNHTYGLDKRLVAKISIGGTVVSTHAAYLKSPDGARRRDVIYPVTRADGWMEVKLGEFVNSSGEDKDLTAIISNTDGSWKSGLIVECMEIRPVN
ncbi:cysteine-rich receptor-like protein kinase 36 [Lolium rigidum]|uniref:cysteine-rich receptor-like protein kinase 36 n=1 Tax=Lolium rigidum TaxID=89674 RepID=UPI001F5D618C|nr:cysteine-rich receptor-like protein kinase 36 [Lolium rigidum]